MVGTQLHTKFPFILDYLKSFAPGTPENKLFQVIDNLDLGHLLRPFKGGNGITFLVPDKVLCEGIFELYEKDKIEEIDKIIKSLIIKFHLGNIASFKSKADDLCNRNDESIEVKTTDKDHVLLANGGKITHMPEFKRGKTNISIFRLSGGSLPLTGPSSSHKYDKFLPKIKGASEVRGGCEIKNILDFTRELEMKYFAKSRDIKRTIGTSAVMLENPYLEVVASFLDYLENLPDQKSLYEKLCSVMDTSPEASYYIMFEPYKTNGDRLIPAEVLKGFVKVANNSIAQYKHHYLNQSVPSALLQRLDDLRVSVSGDCSKSTVCDSILTAYKSVCEDPDLSSHLKGISCELKLWQDTLRFYLRRSISSYWESCGCDIEDFLRNFVYCVQERVPGNNIVCESITHVKDIRNNGNDVFQIYRDFTKSDYFLCMPYTEIQMSRPDVVDVETYYKNPEKSQILGYSRQEFQRLGHYVNSGKDGYINKYVRAAIRRQLNASQEATEILRKLGVSEDELNN